MNFRRGGVTFYLSLLLTLLKPPQMSPLPSRLRPPQPQNQHKRNHEIRRRLVLRVCRSPLPFTSPLSCPYHPLYPHYQLSSLSHRIVLSFLPLLSLDPLFTLNRRPLSLVLLESSILNREHYFSA